MQRVGSDNTTTGRVAQGGSRNRGQLLGVQRLNKTGLAESSQLATLGRLGQRLGAVMVKCVACIVDVEPEGRRHLPQLTPAAAK